MAKTLLYVSIFLLIGVLTAGGDVTTDFYTGQHVHGFEKEITRTVNGQYLLYLPKNYDSARKWPLLMYLHGGMGRGDDIEKMKWYPVVKMCYDNDSLPFIVLSPQCPEGETWTDHEMLIALLDEIVSEYAVDRARIYLAGYSMGGQGVWFFAYMYPDRFTAIAPMSGIGNKLWASKLKHIPVWVFHGAQDQLIPVAETHEMVEAIRAEGGNIRASIAPGRGHSPPTMEEHEELFKWFLEQKRDEE
jgi:predicted peptidase